MASVGERLAELERRVEELERGSTLSADDSFTMTVDGVVGEETEDDDE